ncbi:MAG: hypothetical protein ABRQ24_05560 [Syntrophomonadaceae bacterium]
MGKKSKMGRVIGGLLIGGLLLGGTSLALADSNATGSGIASTIKAGWCGKMAPGPRDFDGQTMQPVLNSLVASNQITQAQADQILARQQQLQTERQQQRDQRKDMTQAEREALREQNQASRIDLLTQLVNEGVITQEQADVIRDSMQQQRKAVRQGSISTALSGLVDKQIITTEQANAIQDKMGEMQNARQAEMEKLRGMTPEQRQAYMEENRPANPLAELVASGVLTQEQVNQIHQAIGPNAQGQGMHKGQGMRAGQGMLRGQGNTCIPRVQGQS